MSIVKALLARGYFPKELPPHFYTSQFAIYATSKSGKKTLDVFKAMDNRTQCVSYDLALPGGVRRHLQIPHPAHYARLVRLIAKHMTRLLKRCHRSPFSSSRPSYSSGGQRAISPVVRPHNLSRRRLLARSTSSYLLRIDISQFYPSVYTHAIGWAIDSKLRQPAHFRNAKFLGKQIDQCIMDLQGKVSQGIPIGPDASFLLGELVLAQIDVGLRTHPARSFRWYDDWEFSCSSRGEAEALMVRVTRALRSFGLRPNPLKTEIIELPATVEDEWRIVLLDRAKKPPETDREWVTYFDEAVRLHKRFPKAPVLLYALGILFKVEVPHAEDVAQACVAQAILSEPGATQKGLALLTYWHLNGMRLNRALVADTIEVILERHSSSGLSSDVSWSLAFCLQHGIGLGKRAGATLARLDDDCTALQALHMFEEGLLPRGFAVGAIESAISKSTLDDQHWLLSYEALRHGFLSASSATVAGHSLFSQLIKAGISFYRKSIPPYALMLHPGGAPEWIIANWMRQVIDGTADVEGGVPALALVSEDYGLLDVYERTLEEVVDELIGIREPKLEILVEEVEAPYR